LLAVVCLVVLTIPACVYIGLNKLTRNKI
jgi:hypothetical protein